MADKSILEIDYLKLDKAQKKQYVKEWESECNECGKKWTYLAQVENEMERQSLGNALTGLGCCCNPCVTTATSNANTQLSQQLAKLKSCPKCGSSNVKRTPKYFKKQQ